MPGTCLQQLICTLQLLFPISSLLLRRDHYHGMENTGLQPHITHSERAILSSLICCSRAGQDQMVPGTTGHRKVLGFIHQLLSSTPERCIPLECGHVFSSCSANLSFPAASPVPGSFMVSYPMGGKTEAQKA